MRRMVQMIALVAALGCGSLVVDDDTDVPDVGEAETTDDGHGDGHPEDGDGMEVMDGRP